MIFWIIGIIIYLGLGLFTRPYSKDYSWPLWNKILIHIFWLPIFIIVYLILRFGGGGGGWIF